MNQQNPAATEMSQAEREHRQRYAEALRLERIRANLTQPEFGELVGVSRATVQRWEWGTVLPTARMRRRLAERYPRLRDLQADDAAA